MAKGYIILFVQSLDKGLGKNSELAEACTLVWLEALVTGEEDCSISID